MLPLLSLSALLNVLVSVDTTGDATCPSGAAVEAALAVRLPGTVLSGEAAAAREGSWTLRLVGQQGQPRMEVYDDDNQMRLERQLPPPRHAQDCVALADTVALIFERLLYELNVAHLQPPEAQRRLEPQPSGHPQISPPAWTFVGRLRHKSGRPGVGGLGLELGAGHAFSRLGWQWLGEAAAGAAWPGRFSWAATRSGAGGMGEGTRTEGWLSVAFGPFWQRRTHQLSPRLIVGSAVLAASRADTGQATRWGVEPWVGLEGLYRWRFGGHGFLEITMGARAALIRHDVVVRDDRAQAEGRVVSKTPRLFGDSGIGVGVSF